MSKIGIEAQEQIALFDWIKLRPDLAPYCFHIPNERKTSPQYGKILKRMGVMSGVSDIFVAIPCAHYAGLWLELKAGKGKPTPNQVNFLANMVKMGYLSACVVGFEAAREVVETYLAMGRRNRH